jgi:hypothetical protein
MNRLDERIAAAQVFADDLSAATKRSFHGGIIIGMMLGFLIGFAVGGLITQHLN